MLTPEISVQVGSACQLGQWFNDGSQALDIKVMRKSDMFQRPMERHRFVTSEALIRKQPV